jgi:hypothetical protein
MNTTLKGSEFEDKMFVHLAKKLKNGELLVNPKTSKIYQKKPYFSKDRNSNIVVDISIEVEYKRKEGLGLLLIIECKNYGHPVPVDDLEEFYAKVQQIAGLNVKAIFVTRSSLQKSAYEYAKARGIGVMRVLPDDQVKMVMYKLAPTVQNRDEAEITQRKVADFESGLLNNDHMATNRKSYAFTGNIVHENSEEIFLTHLRLFEYKKQTLWQRISNLFLLKTSV